MSFFCGRSLVRECPPQWEESLSSQVEGSEKIKQKGGFALTLRVFIDTKEYSYPPQTLQESPNQAFHLKIGLPNFHFFQNPFFS